jgi:hypothetical protein
MTGAHLLAALEMPTRWRWVGLTLGLQQFFLRPEVRFFLLDHTALELFTKLPLYSAIPVDGKNPTVPFKRTYTLEEG